MNHLPLGKSPRGFLENALTATTSLPSQFIISYRATSFRASDQHFLSPKHRQHNICNYIGSNFYRRALLGEQSCTPL